MTLEFLIGIAALQMPEILRRFSLDENDLFAVGIVKAEKFAQIFPVRSLTLVRRKLKELNRNFHFDVVVAVAVVPVG